MEEVPLQSNESVPSAESSVDPIKIGDILLEHGYELPKPEFTNDNSRIASEKDPKLLISREKLRDKLSRFREQKAVKSKERSGPEPETTAELKEVNFDRRSEVIDEKQPGLTEEQTTKETVNEASPKPPPQSSSTYLPSPPPLLPPTRAADEPIDHQIYQGRVLNKPLLYGLIAGTVTGCLLILAFLR